MVGVYGYKILNQLKVFKFDQNHFNIIRIIMVIVAIYNNIKWILIKLECVFLWSLKNRVILYIVNIFAIIILIF